MVLDSCLILKKTGRPSFQTGPPHRGTTDGGSVTSQLTPDLLDQTDPGDEAPARVPT